MNPSIRHFLVSLLFLLVGESKELQARFAHLYPNQDEPAL